MHSEFLALIKVLNVPLRCEDDIAELNPPQKQWVHWSQRERQHAAVRIAAEQKLLVAADAILTGTGYVALRRGFGEQRGRVGAQAAPASFVTRRIVR